MYRILTDYIPQKQGLRQLFLPCFIKVFTTHSIYSTTTRINLKNKANAIRPYVKCPHPNVSTYLRRVCISCPDALLTEYTSLAMSLMKMPLHNQP